MVNGKYDGGLLLNDDRSEMSRLRGRLEKVSVLESSSETNVYANFGGKKLRVNYGNQYIKKDILVRFGHFNDGINFINSEFPEHFKGLDQLEYVLLAMWEKKMRKIGKYPTFEEIKHYYDPLNMHLVIYFKKKNSATKGRVVISRKGPSKSYSTLSRIIRKKLQNPNRSSRLIIMESRDNLERLKNIVMENGMKPILMESLKGY